MRTLALLAAFLLAPGAFAEEASTGSGISFPISKGGKHLIGIGALIGTGAGSIIFIAGLTGGPNRDLAVAGGAAIGMVALFLGGGLTAGHLLDPTPPMAWSSFFAGAAGAGVGLGLMVTSFPFGPPSVEAVILSMAIGYALGAGIDLALPGRDTLSWKDFWVPMVVSIVPGAAIIFLGAVTSAFRAPEFAVVAMFYPVVSFLVTRGILAAVRPFDPWFDDLAPPFRAEPIITFNSSGASIGIAATF